MHQSSSVVRMEAKRDGILQRITFSSSLSRLVEVFFFPHLISRWTSITPLLVLVCVANKKQNTFGPLVRSSLFFRVI